MAARIFLGLSALVALALGGVLRTSLERPALIALLFLTTGLASARMAGVALDGSPTSYTLAGLGFELTTALVSGWLLARAPLEPARG